MSKNWYGADNSDAETARGMAKNNLADKLGSGPFFAENGEGLKWPPQPSNELKTLITKKRQNKNK